MPFNRLTLPDMVEYFEEQLGGLRSKGAHYWAICPFHQDSSPSLCITPHKLIWKCFGCNEGGDIVAFHMKYHGLDFVAACKDLGAWESRRSG